MGGGEWKEIRRDEEKLPEVSDETGALLVYSCFITYKILSHRPIHIEHARLLDM